MPIGQPFNSQFKDGDVIYGTNVVQSRYVNSLPEATVHRLRSQGQFIFMDDYLKGTFTWSSAKPAFLSGDDIKFNLAANRNAPDMNVAQKAELTKYYSALAGTRFAPLKAVDLAIERVKEKGNIDCADLAIRRACKFGMEYVIRAGRTVHFVLDHPRIKGFKINSCLVVNSAKFGDLVPYTTSELRCCYRNRRSWMPTGRLKFYFELREVEAPWVTDSALWAEYEQHRIGKGVAVPPLRTPRSRIRPTPYSRPTRR